MVSGIVLVKLQGDRINDAAQEMLDIPGVTEVYSVAGRYDLAVVVRCADNEALAETVTGRLLKTPGIRDSETLIAFRTYSRTTSNASSASGWKRTEASATPRRSAQRSWCAVRVRRESADARPCCIRCRSRLRSCATLVPTHRWVTWRLSRGLGGPRSRAGWDLPLDGDAQKGGGPVDKCQHGSTEVASR